MAIPNGWYLAQPLRDKAEFGKSGTDGVTKQLFIPVEIVEAGDHKGKLVPWTGTFAPGDSIRITMDGLKTMGWDGSTIKDLRGVGLSPIEILVENDQRYGAKIKTMRVPGKQFWRGGLMAKDEVSGLDALLKAAAAQPRTQNKPAAQQRSQPQGGGGHQEWDGQGANPNGDDDVPFISCDLSAEPGMSFMRFIKV